MSRTFFLLHNNEECLNIHDKVFFLIFTAELTWKKSRTILRKEVLVIFNKVTTNMVICFDCLIDFSGVFHNTYEILVDIMRNDFFLTSRDFPQKIN